MSLRDKGQIRQEVCARHKYFEWDLDREFFDFSQYLDVTSPVFKVGLQSFYLEMSPKCRYTLRLYREGPCVNDAIYAWCAGVISFKGTDQGPIYNGRLNLSEELVEWKHNQRLFTVRSSYLHNSCLRLDGKITFYFQINVSPAISEKKGVEVPCNHGPLRSSPTSVGCIVEREWEMYKKVQWNIPCKSIRDCHLNSFPVEPCLNEPSKPKVVFKSSVFEIADQTYYFSLEISRDSSSHYIILYKSGPAVNMIVRWWMQLRNGPNSIFVSKNMDLKRGCFGWTYSKRLISFEQLIETSFSVEFLMSKVDIMHACSPPYYIAISCGVMHTTTAGKSPLDFDPSRTEFISFRVKDHDFTVHRSLLTMRVPVFEAMLSHDTVESRTGVVCVDDCDPVVIGMFLHYVDTGNGPMWDAKHPLVSIHLAAGLVVMADKYLVPELRDKCLTFLEEIAQGKNSEYMMFVGDKVKEITDILSTIPPEILQKWHMIQYFYNCAD